MQQGEHVARRWRVVGTAAPVRALLDLLDDPDIGLVLLTGPAGIGKTALAQAAMGAAADDGRPVLRVVASPGTAERPYGALGALLEVAEEGGGAVPTGPRLDVAGPGADLRLLLVVDDLPLLDPASSAEVANLVRRGDVVVVATARAGTTLPAAVDGLAVEGRVVTRELAPLDLDQLDEAVRAALGGPLTSDALRDVHERSGGVPLHARELVTANVQAGRIVAGDDRWELVDELLAPKTLFDLVSSRFLGLGDLDRRSVEALCLAQPLPVPDAATLVGSDVLADLERSELVTVADEVGVATVRLAHPLYEESVRSSLSPLRRRAAIEHAADALHDAATRNPDLAYRLACLRLEHDLPLPATDALVAAQRALNLLDPVTAVRFVERSGDPSVETLLLHGAALAAQGRPDEANAVLADAWGRADTDERRARVLSRRAGTLGAGAGRFDEAMALLIDGIEAVTDPHWRAFLDTDLAYVRSWAGERTEVVAAGEVAASPQVRANECLVGSIMAAMAGEVGRVEPLVAEGLTVVSTIERDVPHARDVLVLARFLGRAFGGDAAGARAVADEELDQARASSSGATGVWLSVRSLQSLVDGDAHGAMAEATQAVDQLVLGDVAGLRPLAWSVRAVACARLGDLDGSQAAAAAIEPSWRDEVKVQLHLTQAAAWQEVCAGRTGSAVDLLLEAGRVGLDANHQPLGGLAAYDAVRLGHARRALDLLRTIASRWDGPMAATILEHAEVVAAAPRPGLEDLDRLTAVAERLPRLGLTIAASNAWLQVEQAASAQGDDERYRRARLARARAPWADAASPAAGRPQLLTDREWEVARAAADGRTSREVAETLGRSVRTVDNHLAAVYRKLGVSGRSGLGPVLAELDADGRGADGQGAAGSV